MISFRTIISNANAKRAAKRLALWRDAGVAAGHPIYRHEVFGDGHIEISYPAETEGKKIVEARRK